VGAMRVQVVPDDVHLFVWVRACHALHEGHQIVPADFKLVDA
jgi:hypothetical protein